MNRLSKLLEKKLHARTLTPIIVETPRFEDIAGEVSNLVPELRNRLTELAPRLFDATVKQFGFIKTIRSFRMVSFPATPRLIETLAQDRRVEKLHLDRMMYAFQLPKEGQFYDKLLRQTFTTTYYAKKALGADLANAQGYTGEGTTLAVIDTLGWTRHEQLPHIEPYTVMKGQPGDGNGHGVHTSTIAAGKPSKDPFFRLPVEGVAPDVRLVTIKTLGYVLGFGSESDSILAMEKAMSLNADVVNMSLGSEVTGDEASASHKAVAELTRRGIVVCAAAGNSGPDGETVNDPGDAPDALTFGAVGIDGKIKGFSSRGPTRRGLVKPDAVSYGENILSGVVGILDPLGDNRIQRYSILSGTSMSTPFGAGLVCLMKQYGRRHGIAVNTPVIKDVLAMHGESKSNTSGWGLLTWKMWLDHVGRG